jgi:hypothetical protein
VPMNGLSGDDIESSDDAGEGGVMGPRSFFMDIRIVMKAERRASC